MVTELPYGVGPEKVVWGSDCYFYSEAHQIGKVLGAALPEEVKAQRAQNFQMKKENSDRSRRSRTLTPENP